MALANALRYLGSVHAQHVQDIDRRYAVAAHAAGGRNPHRSLDCRAWHNLEKCKPGFRRARKLVIDLTHVTVISPEGEDALFDLMKKGVNFSSGSVLTKHVLKQLARKKQQ